MIDVAQLIKTKAIVETQSEQVRALSDLVKKLKEALENLQIRNGVLEQQVSDLEGLNDSWALECDWEHARVVQLEQKLAEQNITIDDLTKPSTRAVMMTNITHINGQEDLRIGCEQSTAQQEQQPTADDTGLGSEITKLKDTIYGLTQEINKLCLEKYDLQQRLNQSESELSNEVDWNQEEYEFYDRKIQNLQYNLSTLQAAIELHARNIEVPLAMVPRELQDFVSRFLNDRLYRVQLLDREHGHTLVALASLMRAIDDFAAGNQISEIFPSCSSALMDAVAHAIKRLKTKTQSCNARHEEV